ncbi:MAG: hypothetical protein WKG01_08900 [Kofleriaceae bacterium]
MLTDRFERLAAIRGDVVKGLAATAWATNLADVERDVLMRALIDAVRSLILPDWIIRRPEDLRPQTALEVAESWLASRSIEQVAAAKEAAKACTAARNETFGDDHRVPEAARAVAWAVGANDNDHLWDALTAIEGELLARITLISEYQRAPAQRRAILDVLKRHIAPPPPAEDAPAPTAGPVAYAASGNFTVGQQLTHAKFGDLVVPPPVTSGSTSSFPTAARSGSPRSRSDYSSSVSSTSAFAVTVTVPRAIRAGCPERGGSHAVTARAPTGMSRKVRPPLPSVIPAGAATIQASSASLVAVASW